MRHISYNPKNTVDRNGFQKQEALTQWSCVVHVCVCDLSVEEVVKNFNLLLQLVLGWQEAMLLELQQASVYNITEDWIGPHCKCLNLVVFVPHHQVCAANFGEFCSIVGQEATEKILVRLAVFLLCLYLEQYCSHRQNECI